jgi:peroxiredoxin
VTETKSLDQALAEAFSKADHLQAPLDQRLKLYLRESRKLLPEMEATYDQLVARITANIHDSNQIPQVGEVLPDFCMTDSEGTLVELTTLKGPLVVSFNRGPWCDYCGLELHSLARAYPEIVAAGGDVISIVPETARYARALQAARGVPFRVLTDMDLGYALNLGLIFWVGDKIMDMYRGFGIDLAISRKWRLVPPHPGDAVVGRDGRSRPASLIRLPPTHAHRGYRRGGAGGRASPGLGPPARSAGSCGEGRKGRDNGQFA